MKSILAEKTEKTKRTHQRKSYISGVNVVPTSKDRSEKRKGDIRSQILGVRLFSLLVCPSKNLNHEPPTVKSECYLESLQLKSLVAPKNYGKLVTKSAQKPNMIEKCSEKIMVTLAELNPPPKCSMKIRYIYIYNDIDNHIL